MQGCLPEITPEQAKKLLTRRSVRRGFRQIPPERVELLYFPFYRFSLEVEDRHGRRQIPAAADGILGTLVFLSNPRWRWAEEEVGMEFAFALTPEEARTRVREAYRWVLFRARLKRHSGRLLAVEGGEAFGYPYWAGYFRVRGKWDFALLDAVTGLGLGGPLRQAFLHALLDWAADSK